MHRNRFGTFVVMLLVLAACATGTETTASTTAATTATTAAEASSTTTEASADTTTTAAETTTTAQPTETVSIAVERFVTHETIFGFMQTYCPENGYGIEIEHVLGSARYLDRIVLLQQKDIDLAASGYATIPVVAEQDLPIVTIAGTNLGATDLIVRADVEINDWADLVGKKIGTPTGSLATHSVVIGLEENGIDPSQVEILSMVPGPQATVALVRGELDAVAGWEPWTSQVVVDQLGYIPFDYTDTGVGPLNGALQVHRDNLGEPKIARFVECMVAAAEHLNSNPEEHVAAMREWSGLSQAVAEHASSRFVYDTNIYQANTQSYADIMFNFDLLREDISDKVPDVIDYALLEAATGKSADDLGRGDMAPNPPNR